MFFSTMFLVCRTMRFCFLETEHINFRLLLLTLRGHERTTITTAPHHHKATQKRTGFLKTRNNLLRTDSSFTAIILARCDRT
jgi:hypothetical protein